MAKTSIVLLILYAGYKSVQWTVALDWISQWYCWISLSFYLQRWTFNSIYSIYNYLRILVGLWSSYTTHSKFLRVIFPRCRPMLTPEALKFPLAAFQAVPITLWPIRICVSLYPFYILVSIGRIYCSSRGSGNSVAPALIGLQIVFHFLHPSGTYSKRKNPPVLKLWNSHICHHIITSRVTLLTIWEWQREAKRN